MDIRLQIREYERAQRVYNGFVCSIYWGLKQPSVCPGYTLDGVYFGPAVRRSRAPIRVLETEPASDGLEHIRNRNLILFSLIA